MKASLLTRTLLLSAIDLTRACAAQEHYFDWLASHSNALGGSAGVAYYLASAALALTEASTFPSVAASPAALAVHESLSDILMTSPPLS